MKEESSATHDLINRDKKFPRLGQWHRIFKGVRFRILVWYFLLTTCTSLVSIWATRQLFCASLEARAKESLVQEVTRFQMLVEARNFESASQGAIASLFDDFFTSYVPTRNESALALLDGELYQFRSSLSPEWFEENPHVVERWAQLTQRELSRIDSRGKVITYAAEPIAVNGETRGVLVAVYDATDGYQANTQTVILLLKVTLVVLTLFALLAWVTAGRALSPLRLLTQTARSITESDMSRRIPVRGSDEIAELTCTFNAMLDRLQVAFSSQQALLRDVGHELRTPITVIQGHLELLQYKPERQQQTIELVVDELSRMNRLVNDILLLAKSERSDFLTLKPEELDWLTEELYLKVRGMANRDWRLESKGLSPIVVDRQRLTQAVMNLVQNAIRHTQAGDIVALGSMVRGDYAYIWVRDTGEGIAPEDQERIFDRFARATDRDRYAEGEGAGLGLSIVEAIAQAHGGWVELSSSLGCGSTFTIAMPLDCTQQVTDNAPDSHRRRQPSHYRISRSRITGARVHHSGR